MTKPDNIEQWAWDRALNISENYELNSHNWEGHSIIYMFAQALMDSKASFEAGAEDAQKVIAEYHVNELTKVQREAKAEQREVDARTVGNIYNGLHQRSDISEDELTSALVALEEAITAISKGGE